MTEFTSPPAHTFPIAAPDPNLVSDDMLRALARQSPDRDRGVFSEQDQAMLAMILPDICGELLAHRLLAATFQPDQGAAA